jgi:hypothetical protein
MTIPTDHDIESTTAMPAKAGIQPWARACPDQELAPALLVAFAGATIGESEA